MKKGPKPGLSRVGPFFDGVPLWRSVESPPRELMRNEGHHFSGDGPHFNVIRHW